MTGRWNDVQCNEAGKYDDPPWNCTAIQLLSLYNYQIRWPVPWNEICATPSQVRGRPRSTNTRHDRHVTLTNARDRFVTTTTTPAIIRHIHNIQVSIKTIRRRLRASRLTSRHPYLEPVVPLEDDSWGWCGPEHMQDGLGTCGNPICSVMNPDFVWSCLTGAFMSGDVWGAIRVMLHQGRW